MTAQTRRGDGKFRSSYSDERCYELIRLTALKVDALDPAALSQPKFDARAAEVAVEQGWPEPPKANAIYMRLTRQRKRTWRQLVESALTSATGNLTQTVGAQTREFPAPLVRRAAHLLRPPPRAPFPLSARAREAGTPAAGLGDAHL